MTAARLELIRFILRPTPANFRAFADLRQKVSSHGLANRQYFGYVIRNEGFPTPKPEDQMCWIIDWPEKSTYRTSEEFLSPLRDVATEEPRSLLFDLKETRNGGIQNALDKGLCQLAIINLTQNAPKLDSKLEGSMNKTFTDTYFAKGFTGGGWGYSLGSNEADGVEQGQDEQVLQEKDRRLAYYLLGWETLQHHHEYAKTELFDEEIDKLKPYFGAGTGAFYVKFEPHT